MEPAAHRLNETTETARRILRQRAAELAKLPPEDDLSRRIEVVRFQVDEAWYGVEVRHLCEIIPLGKVTPLPGLPAFVAGIVHVRGQIWSILDLRRLLGLGGGMPADGGRAVLIGNGEMEMGLAADRVEGLTSIDPGEISSPAPSAESAARRYLSGIHRSGTSILDGDAILADPDLIVSQ
jgi:purine-binding chemotaxis protein CheW